MIEKIPSKKVINQNDRSREEKRERQIDRWTERKKDRWTDRKKDSKTKILSNAYTILKIPNMTLIIEKSPRTKAINSLKDRETERKKKERKTDKQKDKSPK
jgi:hypothetical protein